MPKKALEQSALAVVSVFPALQHVSCFFALSWSTSPFHLVILVLSQPLQSLSAGIDVAENSLVMQCSYRQKQ